MKQIIYEKLEWPRLLHYLSRQARTVAGQRRCLETRCDLTVEAIEQSWQEIMALRNLVASSYQIPIGELEDLEPLLRAIKLQQILNGEQCLHVGRLLQQTRIIANFCRDFADKAYPLKRFELSTNPCFKLLMLIEKCILPTGDLSDQASEELAQIRKRKLSLRQTIEKKIKQLLAERDIEKYLQDKFYTIRQERYVIPLRVDARGRVAGSIHDTSDSGQTIFVEPKELYDFNEELLDLEVSERLEVARILKDLSFKIHAEYDVLKNNYEQLVCLDVLQAKAFLAHHLKAQAARLVTTPCLDLRQARHPILYLSQSDSTVSNDISLKDEQSVLVVSGPNAGGKTVVLKTVGLIHLMAKAGLLLPCSQDSEIYLFDHIFIELGDRQDIEASLSTFSGHLLGIKSILEEAGPSDLVLLDEIAAGTEPQSGSAIAQAILEYLLEHQVMTVVTTHFDALKSMAYHNKHCRNSSMEYNSETLSPTYRLLMDVPGQSYGIELAEHMGFPRQIVQRAKELRGEQVHQFEQILGELNETRRHLEEKQKQLEKERQQYEQQKAYWQHQAEELKKLRTQVKLDLQSDFEKLKTKLEQDYEEALAKIKQQKLNDTNTYARVKQEVEKKIQATESSIDRLLTEPLAKQNGQAIAWDQLKVGDHVFIRSYGKEAIVKAIPKQRDGLVKVAMGQFVLDCSIDDIAMLPQKSHKESGTSLRRSGHKKTGKGRQEIPFVIPSAHNTLDLRGMSLDEALEKAWAFLDQAVMSGNMPVVFIHGHGTDRLKEGLRQALKKHSPYSETVFRAGFQQEGGDGVTVVMVL